MHPPESTSPLSLVVHADRSTTDDLRVVTMWLQPKAASTRAKYKAEALQLLAFLGDAYGAGLTDVGLEQLHAYTETFVGENGEQLAPATLNRRLATVKSLFTFAFKVGYIERNWGSFLSLPKVQDRLAERILTEGAVQRMLALTDDGRDRAVLEVLYFGALRVSEAAGLRWRDLVELDGRHARPPRAGGQVTVFGKGGKTRTVLLPGPVWGTLEDLRPPIAGGDDPVFASRERAAGGRLRALTARTLRRIVKRVADRAGVRVEGNHSLVSPHWLRHAHASHSLDRKAPVHLVQRTLGHSSLATTSRYTHARPDDSSSMYLAA